MNDDPAWPDIDDGAIITEAVSYREFLFAETQADIVALWRRCEWEMYEVDQDWSGFCAFGPDDIGGVWEQLGVIRRKKQPFSSIQIAAAQRNLMDHIERTIIHPDCKFGVTW